MTESKGLTSAEVDMKRHEFGWNEVAEKKPQRLVLFLKKFWGPSAWMIELIAIVSIALHKSNDVIISIGLLAVNAIISFFEEQHAEKTVSLLKQRLQITVTVLRNGNWEQHPARELVPGDIVRIRLGDIAPADLKVREGELSVDQSALTGESGDISKTTNEIVYSGSLVRRGEITAEVLSTGAKTYFGRNIELIQSARPKLHMEEIVSRLVRTLFLVVSLLVCITFFICIFRGESLGEILPLSLVLLMSAVPVALPVMFTVSTAVAAKTLGRKGVLVTRLSAAEDAATMDTLFVDKTGTITQNRLTVAELKPVMAGGEQDLLKCAALASDRATLDSIDKAILTYCEDRHIDTEIEKRTQFIPFSPETRRIEGVYGEVGRKMIATKGALREVLLWSNANAETVDKMQALAEQGAQQGYRSIAVAKSSEEKKQFLGLIFLQDPPRSDSQDLIKKLKDLGIQIMMLTGDTQPVAQEIAKRVGLGKILVWQEGMKLNDISGGLAQVFPETKYRAIEVAQQEKHIVGMTGDGINDAPALKKAEVGIAVYSAADVAKSAASVVLTTEGLSGIVDLIDNGRAVFQRIQTWVLNKISRTVLKSGFVIGAYLIFGKFVISASAMILIVFMTDFAKISLSTDNVRISSKPDTWELRPLAILGALLGVAMVVESLAILWIGIHLIGLKGFQIHTYSFLVLLFMAIFSVTSVREKKWFWCSRPSSLLLGVLGLDIIFGIVIGILGLFELPGIGALSTFEVLLLSFVSALLINDGVKILLRKLLFKQDK